MSTLIETGIRAHDPRRVYYIDEDGVPWDLQPGIQPSYRLVTDLRPKDTNRVYIQDTSGMLHDVMPDIAARYTRSIVTLTPAMLGTLQKVLCQ